MKSYNLQLFKRARRRRNPLPEMAAPIVGGVVAGAVAAAIVQVRAGEDLRETESTNTNL